MGHLEVLEGIKSLIEFKLNHQKHFSCKSELDYLVYKLNYINKRLKK